MSKTIAVWNRPASTGLGVLELGGVLQDHAGDATTAEHRRVAVLADQVEGDGVAVVGDHAVEVADPEGDGAHGGVGGEEIGCVRRHAE